MNANPGRGALAFDVEDRSRAEFGMHDPLAGLEYAVRDCGLGSAANAVARGCGLGGAAEAPRDPGDLIQRRSLRRRGLRELVQAFPVKGDSGLTELLRGHAACTGGCGTRGRAGCLGCRGTRGQSPRSGSRFPGRPGSSQSAPRRCRPGS